MMNLTRVATGAYARCRGAGTLCTRIGASLAGGGACFVVPVHFNSSRTYTAFPALIQEAVAHLSA